MPNMQGGMWGDFINGGFLAGDMVNPPPVPPHQDGSRVFHSTLFEEVSV